MLMRAPMLLKAAYSLYSLHSIALLRVILLCLLLSFFPSGIVKTQVQTQVQAQDSSPSTVWFVPLYNDKPIQLERNYYNKKLRDSIRFESIRFYLSDICFYKDSALVYALPQHHYLIDAENPGSERISYALPDSIRDKVNSIGFTVGVDSLRNVSGAAGGVLDPMHGMYWTWQSGYINVKVEGSSPAFATRKHRFQYHIGGYQAPYNSVRQLRLRLPAQWEGTIVFDIESLLERMDIPALAEVMSPGTNALHIADAIAASFRLMK